MLVALLAALASHTVDSTPVHRGFFLRADLGFGYFSASGGGDSMTGGAGGLGLGIGGGISDNLALFGELFDAAAANPQFDGQSTQNASAGIGGLGIGITYYLMPSNFFVSGILGIGRLITESNGAQGSTDAGLIGRVGFGKEWMVSQSWGLGVAGYLNFGSNHDQNGGPTWNTVSPIIAFSATFY